MSESHTAACIARDVASQTRRATDLCAAALTRLANLNDSLNAVLEVTAEHARAHAAEVDAVAQNKAHGPLAGVPVLVKDNICTAFGRTTCASRLLEHYESPYAATAVERLESAGAVIIGKTNLDEFAMGSSNENSAFGPVRNPWDPARVTGGSSGGSAAAVAAGITPLALGSDTGGSIRQPAAFCGVVGLKPTYGRVSRYGLAAYGSSLDQIGPIATTVTDAALVLGVIAGHDPHDSTSATRPVVDYFAAVAADEIRDADKLRIGAPREFFGEGLDAEIAAAVREAIERYRDLGARVIDISLPHVGYSVAAYYLIATAEASSNLARYDGVRYGRRAADATDILDLYSRSREEGFGPEVQRRLMLGAYALSSGYYDAYYDKALRVRRLIQQDFTAAFEQVDVIIGPTTPAPAFLLGEKTDDPLSMYLADIYTVPANLAGVPAISLPCGFTAAGLPIGLQLHGRPFDEAGLLAAARIYERETDWRSRRPPLFADKR